jgi:hypothetical protein
MEQGKAWWRYPLVWMVIGGPVCVVLASIATLGVAIHMQQQDPPFEEDVTTQNAAEHVPGKGPVVNPAKLPAGITAAHRGISKPVDRSPDDSKQ